MSVRIKILEPDSNKREELLNETIKAVTGLPFITELETVEDIEKIKKFDVPETPCLVVENKVKVFGRIPKKEEIRKLIQEEYKSA